MFIKQYVRNLMSGMPLLKTISCLLLLSLLLNGCAKFVTVDPPKDKLLAKDVYNSEATTRAALAGIFKNMYEAGILAPDNNMSAYWVDEMQSHSVNDAKLDYYLNNVLPSSNIALYSTWTYPYSHLFNINMLIEGVTASQQLPLAFKNEMLGQGLFLRALTHFFLVNSFGDIPYVESVDLTVNQKIHKLPVDTVMARIHRDLKTAIALLPENYTEAGNRIYPNKFVAEAFRARVCLHTGDWEEAIRLASELIDRPAVYKLETDLSKVFLYQSTETVWQFKPITETFPATESWFILVFPPTFFGGSSLNRTVLEDFEYGDLRRKNWIDSMTTVTGAVKDTFYYPFKYKQRSPKSYTSANREYSVFIRLAELFLIRAEACAQKERYAEACGDINQLRSRAGLNDFHSTDKEEILKKVLQERRSELFTEGQHRFFDLKRMAKANEILGQRKSTWRPDCIIYPKPKKDLLANPNL